MFSDFVLDVCLCLFWVGLLLVFVVGFFITRLGGLFACGRVLNWVGFVFYECVVWLVHFSDCFRCYYEGLVDGCLFV